MDAILRNKGWIALLALAALVCAVWWQAVRFALELAIGGLVIAGLLSPMVKRHKLRYSHTASVALAFGSVLAALSVVVALMMPALTDQARELARVLPEFLKSIEAYISRVNYWLAGMHLPQIGIDLSSPEITGRLTALLGGTVSIAGGMLSGLVKLGLMVTLAFYFLNDSEKMLLQAELMIPVKYRMRVLRVLRAIRRELSTYIRGQLIIALVVGVLTGAGLAVIGVPYFMVLGMVMVVCNLIPYVGPVIGGVPAVLMALRLSVGRAVWALVVVVLVQQLDGLVIAPRVMSGTTGMNPALVMLGVAVGAYAAGVMGMVFALPVMLIARACLISAQFDET